MFKRMTKHGFSKRPPGFWLWALTAYLLALAVFGLLLKIAFSGNELTEKAMEGGQSVILHLATGAIDGHVHYNATRSANAASPAIPAPGMAPATGEAGPIGTHDGVPAWKYYARPYIRKEKHPMVAIVFTNLGLSKSLTEEALKLPRDFTLGFSPYAGDTGKWAAKAHEAGFESLVVLPMQGENYPLSDPGPFGLMEDLPLDDNISRLHSVLTQYSGFIGVLAPVDEKMTADREAIKPYLSELKNRGLLFVYVKNNKNVAMADLTKANGFYVLGADRVIDTEITRSAIDSQLQGLIDLAKKEGVAIGLAHTYPPTLEALRNWVDDLPAQGIELAPVSAVAKQVLP